VPGLVSSGKENILIELINMYKGPYSNRPMQHSNRSNFASSCISGSLFQLF
jgi:hypothetical protein